jgi:hypothetical protein
MARRTLLPIVIIFTITTIILTSNQAQADRYVRADAQGSGNGSDWTNAYTSIATAEANITRGETIWVADGTYGAVTFNVPVSGTTRIYVKKATAATHGTDTGWDNAYGDGQATFSNAGTVLHFVTGYWTLDGVTGTGRDAHGFVVQMTSLSASPAYGIALDAGNVTIAHTEVYHTDPCGAVTTYDPRQDLIRTAGQDNIILQYVYAHDSVTNVIMAGSSTNWLIEYSDLEMNNGTRAHHGQLLYIGYPSASNFTIRYNTFKNGNSTGYIFLSTTVYNVELYGNIFQHDADSACSGSGVLLGSNPGSCGSNCVTGIRFYNNTIVNLRNSNLTIDIGFGNISANNLWYGSTPSFTNITDTYNYKNISDPSYFVNYAGGNFRLAKPTTNGTTLGIPYNADMDGNIRGKDGVWDRGAFEYVGPPLRLPKPPGVVLIN